MRGALFIRAIRTQVRTYVLQYTCDKCYNKAAKVRLMRTSSINAIATTPAKNGGGIDHGGPWRNLQRLFALFAVVRRSEDETRINKYKRDRVSA